MDGTYGAAHSCTLSLEGLTGQTEVRPQHRKTGERPWCVCSRSRHSSNIFNLAPTQVQSQPQPNFNPASPADMQARPPASQSARALCSCQRKLCFSVIRGAVWLRICLMAKTCQETWFPTLDGSELNTAGHGSRLADARTSTKCTGMHPVIPKTRRQVPRCARQYLKLHAMKDVRNTRQRTRTFPPLVGARLEATRRRVPETAPSVAVNARGCKTVSLPEHRNVSNSAQPSGLATKQRERVQLSRGRTQAASRGSEIAQVV